MSAITVEKSREILEDLADYRRWVEDVEAGRVTPASFRRRLLAGMYGQMQPGVQMLRVKIPDGIVSSSQLRALASASRKFSSGVLHITTRQAIQLHYIPRAQTPDLLDELADHGLTGREGCGNTVRAVTVDPLAGLSKDQVFDVRPVADAIFRFFLLNPLSQNLPRKFKISLSGSKADRALAFMHDAGFVATIQKGKKGFRLLAGGGLGALPIGAEVVEEFLPFEQAILASLALVRIHNDHGNRKARSKARLKFVKERWGIEKFQAEFRRHLEELTGSVWGQQFLLSEEHLKLDLPKAIATEVPAIKAVPAPWLSEAVTPQRDGRFAVAVRVPLGDVSADTADQLALLADELGDGSLRTTVEQNIWIPGVESKSLAKLWKGLKALGLSDHRFFEVSNPVACPGRTTCALSLTSSKGLAKAISAILDKHPELDAPGRIRISGCPNSCGHHHIAEIGFHGMSRNVGGKPVPYYQVLVGGGAQDGVTRMARKTVRIAAKHAPEAVLTMLRAYKEKGGKKSVGDFLHKLTDEKLQKLLAPYDAVPSYEEDPSFYRDWDYETQYDARPGLGAHAAVSVDLVDEWLYTAERHYLFARTQLSHRFWTDASIAARLALQQALRSALDLNGTEDTTLESDLAAFAQAAKERKELPVLDLKLADVPQGEVDEAASREFVAEVGALLDDLLILARRNSGAPAAT
jgi:sulfite reductase (ferredoxin)